MKMLLQFILILLPLTLSPQSLAPDIQQKLNAKIDSSSSGLAPGVAVGIVQNGKVVYEGFSGYANLEHQVKIDGKTRFNIASCAKQFTALTALMLTEEKKLSLQDDIRKHLPELYQELDRKITIEQLITHSSGVRSYDNLLALQGKTWWKIVYLNNHDVLKLLEKQRSLDFNPGTAFNYSNSNYVLLTEIVGRSVKQDFKLFSDTLFQSLNMPATSYNNDIGVVLPNKARPYGNWGSWIEYPYVTEVIGDGALFSTLEDLLNWEILLQSGKSKVLSAELINKSQQRISGSANPEYGYGLEFGAYRGMDYRYHDGSTGAFRASMLRFPDQNTAFVVLTNSGQVNTNSLAKACADLVLDFTNYQAESYLARPKWTGKRATPDELAGIYQSQEGAYIHIEPDDKDLIWRLYPYNPIRLILVEGNVYHFEGNKNVEVLFDQGKDANFTVYNPGTKPRTHPKRPDFKLNTKLLASLNGKYMNDETETGMVIEYLAADSLSIQINGNQQVGKLVYTDQIIAGSYSLRVDSKDGKPVTIYLGDSRLKNVAFQPIQP